MKPLHQEFLVPLYEVERAWLRRTVVLTWALPLLFVVIFIKLLEAIHEWWKLWVFDGWHGFTSGSRVVIGAYYMTSGADTETIGVSGNKPRILKEKP